ncbi:glycosyltransferase [Nesterenkonia muleiensis]|uniref:glycosyltransferase n=1 Tax=Nesterenkonia muleiensis TaxID=2282648 RepID=UPI0013008331|nr:glycosyltransferase [Nesterenkonia muleiensis]
MNTLFIGYTRFSVHQYESGSFNATRKTGGFSKEEYTNWLYDRQRLDTRTDIFLQESLPQLQQASHSCDLVHIVTISPSLPEKYKEALQQARSRYRFLRVHETKKRAAPSHPSLPLVKTMLVKRGMQGRSFGMYRLDDDDLLPIDYFERMAPYITDEHVGYRVSFPQGIGAVRAQNGYVLPWTFYEAKSSAGFLTVHKLSSDGQKIYGLEARHHLKGHHRADRNFPVILDGRSPGFFRARHETQDSTLSSSAGPFFTRVVNQVMDRPRAEQDAIGSFFPHVAARISASAEHLPASESLLSAPAQLAVGFSAECHYQQPMLLSGSLHSSVSSPAVHLGITVDQQQSAGAEEFFAEAGFTREAENRYVRPLRCAEKQITDVLEPAHGTTITEFDLSSSEEGALTSLFAAPLKSQGVLT